MLFNRTVINIISVLAIALFLAWIFSDIVAYILISIVLASILKPPADYLSQIHIGGYKMPRAIAILISFGILVGIISLFVLLFIPLISEQIKVISSLDYNELLKRVSKPLQNIENILIKNKLVNKSPNFIIDAIRGNISSIFDKLQIGNIISATSSVFIGALAVIFITFFFLFDRGIIRKNLIAMIPNRYFEVTINAVYKIERLLANYLLGLSLQMLSIFTIISFGLIIADVKYAITMGLFAAMVHPVPFAGPFTSTCFGLIVGTSIAPSEMFENGGYVFFITKILIVYGFTYLTDNVLLQPLILSKSVKAHPLEIFLTVFAGASLAGIVGMIAAIPVYTIIKVSIAEMRRGYKQYKIFKKAT
ncbi:AI-2E family transporter [Thermoflexibacter ruber]|uniref:Predicted PurR-regulated permease PerM n=1 Tax=Thermoflexibacter ruber TaxID=1003 RepID=A0A1I2F7S8_9BACT|nr:AI-2E family transporter [Thermoflexibacter ruber]SFF00590.1 Predicted PurR-regulated permease PerM [Thermoflexibacter ruber]